VKLDLIAIALLLLAALGGAYAVTESVIGRPARIWFATRVPDPWSGLAYCIRCLSFWSAAVMLGVLAAGAPSWVLLPFAALGVARILIEPDNALAGDAEWLQKRSQDDGRRDDRAAAERSEDRDEPDGDGEAAGPPEGIGEESAVRDEADAHRDGGATVHCEAGSACRVISSDGICACCRCLAADIDDDLHGCPCNVCTRAPATQGA
jgi:hypothetical protein